MDYRTLLRDEYQQRRTRNSRYSLRAFASQLGVSGAFMSLLLRGKRSLTEATGKRFAAKLGWPKERKKLFVSLIRYERAGDEESRSILSEEISVFNAELEFMVLRHEQFEVVSDWVHFALVELTSVSGFNSSPKWIARRLGVTVDEVTAAIQRLLDVGLLLDQDGVLKKSQSHYRVVDTPSSAIRSYHRHHIKGALKALEEQEFQNRDISGTTVSFDSSKISEMKDLIREFRVRLNTLCAGFENPDSVYQLGIQFFRLDSADKGA